MKKYRSRFIPFRKRDLLQKCLGEGRLSAREQRSFAELCQVLESVFHFEFHKKLENLKDSYAPFDRDSDARVIRSYSEQERTQCQKQLVEQMTEILEAANYRKITATDLKEALQEESLFKIRLEVNFDDFEDIIFYMRGERKKTEEISKYFGLKKVPFEFTNYERVAVYIKFKEESYFSEERKKALSFTPGSTIIKLFKDVPKADLELLFPNSEIRMKTIDKLIIGLPAAIGGVTVMMTKLSASLLLIGSVLSFWLGFSDKEIVLDQQHLITLGLGLGTLGIFLFKQFSKFQNRKIKFMKTMSDSLYFKNLDNNQGVFQHLIDAAEGEEFKEAMLAYYFLLKSEQPLDAAGLDQRIEDWFNKELQCDMDFEVQDAIDKLVRLELVDREAQSFRAKPIDEAKRALDNTWDSYFNFS